MLEGNWVTLYLKGPYIPGKNKGNILYGCNNLHVITCHFPHSFQVSQKQNHE